MLRRDPPRHDGSLLRREVGSRRRDPLPTWPVEAWEREADERRAACVLVTSVLLLAALRLWMVLAQRPAFLAAYGGAHDLDTGTASGRAIADLQAPNLLGAALFDLVVLLLVVAGVGLAARGVVAGGRYVALVLAGLAATEVLSSLAYVVPWWFLVATLLLLAEVVVTGVVLVRAGRWSGEP